MEEPHLGVTILLGSLLRCFLAGSQRWSREAIDTQEMRVKKRKKERDVRRVSLEMGYELWDSADLDEHLID